MNDYTENPVEARLKLPLEVDTIDGMAKEAFENAEAHGFLEPPFPEQIALIHSEASEALEDDRAGKWALTFDTKGKPLGVGQELADIIIRVGHTAYQRGIDLAEMVRVKMAYNRTRPYKHGKKY